MLSYSNSSAKGYRLLDCSDGSRRVVWLQNCRRDKRSPAFTFRLCEISYFVAKKKMKMINLNIYLFISYLIVSVKLNFFS